MRTRAPSSGRSARCREPAAHLRWRVAGAGDPLRGDELACAALAADPDALAAAVAATADGPRQRRPAGPGLAVVAGLRLPGRGHRAGLLAAVGHGTRRSGRGDGGRHRPQPPVRGRLPSGRDRPGPGRQTAAGDDLATLVDRLFAGHLDRVAESLRARHALGRSLIWGNVAAACASAAGSVRAAAGAAWPDRLADLPRRRPARPGRPRPLDRPHRRRPVLPAHDLLPVVEDLRRRGGPLRRLLARPLPDRDLPHMILFLSNADTELLALGSIVHRLPDGFPAVRAGQPGPARRGADLDGVTAVVVRLLGGRGRLGAGRSTTCGPACVAAERPADRARRRGRARRRADPAVDRARRHRHARPTATWPPAGRANVEHLLRFVADTVLLDGFGFDPPRPLPLTEVWDRAGLGVPGAARDPDRPLVGVVFYRAHLVAGNTQFVADLCRAIEDAGGDALPVSCYSLRPDADGRVEALELLPRPRRRRAGHHGAGHGPGRGHVRRRGRRLAGPAARRPRRAGHPGAGVQPVPRRLGGRRGRADAARRGHGRRHPRVRRPHHRPGVRVQGGGRRRRRARAPR